MQMNDLKLRVPANVKEWLKSRATSQRRTMNGEILIILEKAMQADPAPPKPADKAA